MGNRLLCAEFFQEQIAWHLEKEITKEENTRSEAIDCLTKLEVI